MEDSLLPLAHVMLASLEKTTGKSVSESALKAAGWSGQPNDSPNISDWKCQVCARCICHVRLIGFRELVLLWKEAAYGMLDWANADIVHPVTWSVQ